MHADRKAKKGQLYHFSEFGTTGDGCYEALLGPRGILNLSIKTTNGNNDIIFDFRGVLVETGTRGTFITSDLGPMPQ